MRHHPVVRAHRARLDVPAASEQLGGLREPPRSRGERLAKLGGLVDRGKVREQDPARPQRLDRAPASTSQGLGHVEDDAVEAALVDPRGHVADLDRVVDVLAEEADDVLPRRRGELLAQLVAERPTPLREAASSTARRSPTPASSTRIPGPMSAASEDRAEVLRVDDLGATRHLQHDVGERRAQHEEACARCSPRRRALRRADQVVVRDEARVRVERRALAEPDEVPAVLGVDEQDALADARAATASATQRSGSRTETVTSLRRAGHR